MKLNDYVFYICESCGKVSYWKIDSGWSCNSTHATCHNCGKYSRARLVNQTTNILTLDKEQYIQIPEQKIDNMSNFSLTFVESEKSYDFRWWSKSYWTGYRI